MADGDNSTNELYDLIRKELNSIIVENETKAQKTASNTATNKNGQGDFKKDQQPKNPTQLVREEPPIQNTVETSSENTSVQTKDLPAILANNVSQPITDGAIIDAELQHMRHDLQQSYELFQKMSEKFQAINFGSLKTHIREMNLNKKDSNIKLDDEIKQVVQKHYNANTLHEMTAEMGEKFKQHPGEFGNIPELSEFFKTCTQLQHGLEKLKRQRQSVDNLSKRLSTTTEVSYARIREIQNTMRAKKLSPHQKLDD